MVTEFHIGRDDMEMIYMSPDPYGRTFEAELDLRKCDTSKHRSAGLRFITDNGRLILASMDPSTPGARIDKWRTQLRGAWLISVNGTPVSTLSEVHTAIDTACCTHAHSCVLLFSHPEVSPSISNRGIPIMAPTDFTQLTHDQLNNRMELTSCHDPPVLRTKCYNIVLSGDVRNYTTKAMRLTRGRLIQQDDWSD
jgi:hypothetical protein